MWESMGINVPEMQEALRAHERAVDGCSGVHSATTVTVSTVGGQQEGSQYSRTSDT